MCRLDRLVLTVTVTFAALYLSGQDALAQPRRTYWGVEGSFTPKYRVPDWQKVAFDADSVDLSGLEFRVGFVRGRILGGDWGISFVQRSLKDATAAVVHSAGDVSTTDGNSMRGVEIHRYTPFGTIKDRVQIGTTFGIGAAWLQGTIIRSVAGSPAEQLPAKELLRIDDTTIPVMPLARLELAAAVIVTPNLKVRASGGLAFPGQHTVSITAIYLFAPR